MKRFDKRAAFAFALSFCAFLPLLTFCKASAPTMPQFGRFRFVTIDIPHSPYVQPVGINNAEVVTGYYEDAGLDHGFVWQNGAAQTVDYPGATDTYLNGVNNRGVVIGTYLSAVGSLDDAHSIQHAVTYSLSSSAWTVFPKIRGFLATDGAAINDSGIAVGDAATYPFGHLAWIWHPDSQTYSFFTASGGCESSTHAQGISADGKIVGQVSSETKLGEANYGFLRDRDRYQKIVVPGAVWTIPMGVNNNGMVSGWILTATNGYFGFVRSSGGVLTMVNHPGSTWTHVDGINDHGAICGYWYNPAVGHVQGFLAYPR